MPGRSSNSTSPRTGSIQRTLLVPLVVTCGIITYVVVAGTTGFCPTCTLIMSQVTGGATTQVSQVRELDQPGVQPDRAVKPGREGTFSSLEFQDLEGGTVSMDRYLGKPLLVEVWATWCGPCRVNRKVLGAAQDRLAEHANLVSLSVDRGGAPVVNKFLKNENKSGSRWTELLATDPRFRQVIAPHDKKPTIPKLIYVAPDGSVVDIEYGQVDPDWIVTRLKAFGPSDGVGG